MVKYVPGQSCVQKGKRHEYKKVYGKAYQRCAACGSTRTVNPKATAKPKAGAEKAPASAGEVEVIGAGPRATDTVPEVAAAAAAVREALKGGAYSVRYLKGAIWTTERKLSGALGAVKFAAVASYNQGAAVEILRGGAVVATYRLGAFMTEDAEVQAAYQEAVACGGDYAASANGGVPEA